jgi:predicted acetyltransferase
MAELRLETKLDHIDIVIEELETKLKRIKKIREELHHTVNTYLHCSERGKILGKVKIRKALDAFVDASLEVNNLA